MKTFVIVLMALTLAGAAVAGTIYDVQTGVYAEDDFVEVAGAVVTGVFSYGFYMNELPNGPYTGIWVYTGSGNHTAVVGDEVNVGGYYEEYVTGGGASSLTEINAYPDGTAYVTVVGPHMGTLTALDMTLADINADPEAYECGFIRIVEGMIVIEEPNSYGEWDVANYPTGDQTLAVDNYWYDNSGVLLDQCYLCGLGILHEDYGEYKMRFFEDGLCLVDCSVPNEPMTFGEVKALYR